MNDRTCQNQRGGSMLGNILLLALFAYGVYLAIQYVPQYLEAESLDSILESVETQHRQHPYQSAQEVDQAIRNNLNMNQMDEMIRNFQVRESGSSISIELTYERELDLLFQQHIRTIYKSADLD